MGQVTSYNSQYCILVLKTISQDESCNHFIQETLYQVQLSNGTTTEIINVTCILTLRFDVLTAVKIQVEVF